MKNLSVDVKRFIEEEEGVTAIEYALIAALIAIVIITAVALIGTRLNNVFNCIASKLNDPTASC
jgi:pilus assembly protein Flp/PilA